MIQKFDCQHLQRNYVRTDELYTHILLLTYKSILKGSQRYWEDVPSRLQGDTVRSNPMQSAWARNHDIPFLLNDLLYRISMLNEPIKPLVP